MSEKLVGRIVVSSLSRPSLTMEEIEQEDGSFKVGRSHWSAVTFKLSKGGNFWDYVDKDFAELTLQLNRESWKFYNVRVAVIPRKIDKFRTAYDDEVLCAVFDRAERCGNHV